MLYIVMAYIVMASTPMSHRDMADTSGRKCGIDMCVDLPLRPW